MNDDLWLDSWIGLLEKQCVDGKILELGCDTGRDTNYLVNRGFHVVALDISEEALAKARIIAPSATYLRHDLRDRFPFDSEEFSAVLASLSLHYFDWNKTNQIVQDIKRCLKVEGLLICRLNSVKDKYHGAMGFEEIEPNYYRAYGRYSKFKRFFDASSIKELFENDWKFLTLEEKIINRYEHPKVVWEVVLQKKVCA